jgi:hypothetical protein
MQKFRSQVVAWKTVGASNPADTYCITYRLRSIVGLENGKPLYQSEHQVEIHLPPKYPRCPPTVRVTTRPFVLHPNVYRSGRVCIEDRWKPVGMYLDTICELVGQLIAYQKMNLQSPANPNSELIKWIGINRHNSAMIPTDPAQIRLPEIQDTIVWGSKNQTPPPRIQW